MAKRKYPKEAEVDKIINEQILVSSAVTKSDSEYIIKSAKRFLTQYYMIKTGLITVNENAEALESSMLLSSLDEEDFTRLLNGSLVSQKDKDGSAVFDEGKKLTAEQKARQQVLDQLSEMSCSTIIEHTKETLGSPRVFFESNEFFLKLYAEGYKIGTVVKSYIDPMALVDGKEEPKVLYVKKPAQIDYTKLDLTSVAGLDTWMLLDCVIKYESGFLDILAIPEKALPKDLLTLLKKVNKWSERAVELANNSKHNDTVFNVINDPFQALFGAL